MPDDEQQPDSPTAVGETLGDFSRGGASAGAQEARTDQWQIVLSEDEAVRFVDALNAVDRNMVTRLRELHASCPPKLSPRQ